MPHKHNTNGRHHIPKMRHVVTNWPQYEAVLRRRGNLALWITNEAIDAWAATRRSTPGGHCPRDLLSLGQRQGSYRTPPRRWTDAAGPGQDSAHRRVRSIEQLSYLMQGCALLPAFPHQCLLTVGVVDPS